MASTSAPHHFQICCCHCKHLCDVSYHVLHVEKICQKKETAAGKEHLKQKCSLQVCWLQQQQAPKFFQKPAIFQVFSKTVDVIGHLAINQTKLTKQVFPPNHHFCGKKSGGGMPFCFDSPSFSLWKKNQKACILNLAATMWSDAHNNLSEANKHWFRTKVLTTLPAAPASRKNFLPDKQSWWQILS